MSEIQPLEMNLSLMVVSNQTFLGRLNATKSAIFGQVIPEAAGSTGPWDSAAHFF